MAGGTVCCFSIVSGWPGGIPSRSAKVFWLNLSSSRSASSSAPVIGCADPVTVADSTARRVACPGVATKKPSSFAAGSLRRPFYLAFAFFGRPPSLPNLAPRFPHSRSCRLLCFRARARPPIRATSRIVNSLWVRMRYNLDPCKQPLQGAANVDNLCGCELCRRNCSPSGLPSFPPWLLPGLFNLTLFCPSGLQPVPSRLLLVRSLVRSPLCSQQTMCRYSFRHKSPNGGSFSPVPSVGVVTCQC
jgi:hypothetical protein